VRPRLACHTDYEAVHVRIRIEIIITQPETCIHTRRPIPLNRVKCVNVNHLSEEECVDQWMRKHGGNAPVPSLYAAEEHVTEMATLDDE
jgi:hypothetical protein